MLKEEFLHQIIDKAFEDQKDGLLFGWRVYETENCVESDYDVENMCIVSRHHSVVIRDHDGDILFAMKWKLPERGKKTRRRLNVRHDTQNNKHC